MLHCLGRAEDALNDADHAIRYCPDWAKGHFRRAKALISLGRQEDAIVALLVCAVLEDSSALKSIMEEMVKLFSHYLVKMSKGARRMIKPSRRRQNSR